LLPAGTAITMLFDSHVILVPFRQNWRGSLSLVHSCT